MISLTRLRLAKLQRLGPITAEQAMALIVVCGFAVRLVQALLLPSVWHDEAVVLLSAIHLSFGQLFGPLIHHEAAPPLFMVIERAVYLTLGDSVFAFRLLPLLASCLSVLLMVNISWKLLPRWGAVIAVGLFSFSDRLIAHGVEAKPYALDVLIATATIAFFLHAESWTLRRRCLTVLPVFPVMLWLSFPACFVLGGWFLSQTPALLRSRSHGDWLSALALAGVVAVSFIVLVTGPIAAQRDASMESCWTGGFPDWSRPWMVPIWSVISTLNILGYCISPQGWELMPLAIVGTIVLRRSARPGLLTVLLAPLVLVYIAALLNKYPYCGQRVMVFMMPAACLVVAAGSLPAIVWFKQRRPWANVIVVMALAMPLFGSIHRLIVPWDHPDHASAVAIVRTQRQPDDLIGFNHWEGEYYFRSHRSSWLLPGDSLPKGPLRMWYSAAAQDKNVRETVIRAVPPVWQAQQRWEFQGVTLLLLTTEAADATASYIPSFSE